MSEVVDSRNFKLDEKCVEAFLIDGKTKKIIAVSAESDIDVDVIATSCCNSICECGEYCNQYRLTGEIYRIDLDSKTTIEIDIQDIYDNIDLKSLLSYFNEVDILDCIPKDIILDYTICHEIVESLINNEIESTNILDSIAGESNLRLWAERNGYGNEP